MKTQGTITQVKTTKEIAFLQFLGHVTHLEYASEGARLHLCVLFRGQGSGAGREGRWIAALRPVI